MDYDIINSQLIDGGNGFRVNLAVFTNFNQYLVFESDTTLVANLKILSSTKLL